MRFPEFTDEWEKCVISDFGTVITGNTPPTKDINNYKDGIKLWASPVDLGKTKWIYDTQTKLSVIGFDKTRKLPEGAILVTCIGSTIGKMGMATEEMSTNQQINSIITNSCNDNNFVYYAIESNFPKYLASIAVQAVPIISKSSFEKLPNRRTALKEQIKIGKFLSLIDKRIATQNKIIEDLKKLKSAIVEMILCKQGGVLLKLGDVGSFIRGLTYSSEDIAEDINATTVIRANNLNYGNNVSKKDVVYVNKKPTEIQILRKGDIVICMANGSSSLVGKNSYYSFDDRQSTIGAFCGIYRSSQPLVKWLMQSQRYRRLVYQSLQGGNGAIANLNGDDILNMTFYVVEDKKSVSILSALVLIENSIAVNEKLQELYSMQKEYLLQHLFI